MTITAMPPLIVASGLSDIVALCTSLVLAAPTSSPIISYNSWEFWYRFGIVVTILVGAIGLVKPVTTFLWIAYRALTFLSGTTAARYRRSFLDKHSKVINIYLEKEEVLDLEQTYVPLYLGSGSADERLSALDLDRKSVV